MAESLVTPLFRIDGLVYERCGANEDVFRLVLPTFTLSRGEVTAIIGNSGSGKSTLLNLLGGLESPNSGHIDLALVSEDEPEKVEPGSFPHQRVGRVFQQGYLLRSATVAVNVALALRARERPVTRDAILAILADVGVSEEKIDRRVWQLSGGEQQRVALARAIAGDPDLILADEPTSSLDPDLAADIMYHLRFWCKKGGGNRSVLWVTHNHDQVERYADGVLRLSSVTEDANVTKGEITETVRKTVTGPYLGATVPVPVVAKEAIDLLDPELVQGEAANTNPTPRMEPLARKAALGLMLGRERSAGNTALAPLLSVGAVSAKWASSAFLAFSQWPLALSLVISAFLILGVVAGFIVQHNEITGTLDDPAVCHTRISGIPTSRAGKTNLLPDQIRSLADRPWLTSDPMTAKVPVLADSKANETESPEDAAAARGQLMEFLDGIPASGCTSMSGTWPRYTADARVWLKSETLSCEGTLAAARESRNDGTEGEYSIGWVQTLAAHRNEPALSSIKHETGSYGSSGDAMRNWPNAGESDWPSVILSEAFIRHGLETTPDKMAQVNDICVQVRGKIRSISYLGMAEYLPTDYNFQFGALFDLGPYDETFGIPSPWYSHAALYFERGDISEIETYLRPLAEDGTPAPLRYRFDADSLTRMADTVAASVALRNVFFGVGAVAALLTVLGVWASTTATIAANAHSLAMLLTLGLSRGYILCIVVILSLGVSLVAAVLSLPIWAILHVAMDARTGIWPFDTVEAIAVWTIIAFVTIVLTVLTTSIAFGFWQIGVGSRIVRLLQSA